LDQLQGESGKGVIDLCLDHPLIKEDYPRRFTSVEGMDLFPDLEELSISMHELTNLAGLPVLAHLKRLNLSQNQLDSIQDFPLLPALEFLDLSLNGLTSIQGLPALPTLKELHISFNHLAHLDELPELPALRILTASGNRPLKNIAGLKRISGIEELYFSNCFIPDWEALRDLKALKLLTATPGNPMVLAPLADLASFKTLRLHARRMNAQATLPALRNLTHLSVTGGPQVQVLQGLQEFDHLTHLDLSNNGLIHLPELPTQSLIELNLASNPLLSLGDLADITGLSRLGLGKNKIPAAEIAAFEVARPDVEIFWG